MIKLPRTLLLPLVAIALGLVQPAQANPGLVDAGLMDTQNRYVPAEMLVQFRPDTTFQALQSAVSRLGARSIRLMNSATQRKKGLGELHLVELPENLPMAQAVSMMRTLQGVQFAEPNWLVEGFAKGVDPLYADGSTWGVYGDKSPLHRNEFGSQAAEALAGGKRCGKSVIVAVLDKGVMITHPDLAPNIWVNPYEIAGNGVDDDGNGFIDDVNGWDFSNDDNSVYDGWPDLHGSQVAGIIAARGNNAEGIVGVCPTAKILTSKMMHNVGGTTADAIDAINYVVDMKQLHQLNIVAMNASWGSNGYSQGMFDAIERANDEGIVFVAAVGNGVWSGTTAVPVDNDKTPMYPASYAVDNVIAVTALDSTGGLVSYANYGLTSVDIAAPGKGIMSTGHIYDPNGGDPLPAYFLVEGTSFAAPHVTGAVALYASLHPRSTPLQIKSAILASATPTPSLTGKAVTGGRLNVGRF